MGIEAVQVRVDEGEWRDAELGGAVGRYVGPVGVSSGTRTARRGGHAIEVRAIDGNGDTQPEGPQAVAPDGAEGYHRIVLDVG